MDIEIPFVSLGIVATRYVLSYSWPRNGLKKANQEKGPLLGG